MFGKIAIRNIPQLVWQGLEALAERNYRSVEGEARMALQAWVEPQIQANERSSRRIEISSRLRALVEEARRAMPGRVLKASHIAQGIGANYVEPVEMWLAGEAEPSFAELQSVAAFLGGGAEWLQHGDGAMFHVEGCRIPEDASAGVRWLLDMPEDSKSEIFPRLSQLHLVRDGHKSGRLAVVKQYGEFQCRTFLTPHHISEDVGNDGRSSLTHLSVIFQLLDAMYKKRLNVAGVQVIKSYILPEADFTLLVNGKVHPLSLLRFTSHDRPWWEDIWDKSMFHKNDYWDGWKSLCVGVFDAVQSNRPLREEAESIRSVTHPLLNI